MKTLNKVAIEGMCLNKVTTIYDKRTSCSTVKSQKLFSKMMNKTGIATLATSIQNNIVRYSQSIRQENKVNMKMEKKNGKC